MKRTDIQNIYALSPMQEGMLFHHQLNKESPLYFEQTTIKIEGSLDIAIFEQSFNHLIQKHEVLRTVFTFQKTEKPRQVVLKARKATIVFRDLSQLDEEARIQELERFAVEDRARGFDLGKDILMRIALFRIGETVYHAIWSFHHIIMDGWCFGILMRDFMEIYHRIHRQEPLENKKPTPYSAYISWLERQDKESGLAYWRDYLAGFQGGIQLPKRTRLINESFDNQQEYEIEFDPELTGRLAEAARESGATLNALVMAMWGILLGRLLHRSDVMCGCVVSGRPAEIPGIGQMVGLFINTIPVRIQTTNPAMPFCRFLEQLQERILLSQAYEFVPLVEIMAQTPLSRDLFDHIIGFENYPLERNNQPFASKGSTFTIRGLQFFEQTNYDLAIIAIPTDTIRVRFKYNESVYRRTLIEQMANALKYLALQVAAEPELPLHDLRLQAEEQSLFNGSDAPFETFLPFIIRHLNEARNSVCAIDASAKTDRSLERAMTWGFLQEKSRAVSKKLLASGCRPGDIVAVSCSRSLEWVIFINGILQANSIYMPVDKNLPEERKRFMASDSGIKMLLSDHVAQWVGECVRQVIFDRSLEDEDDGDNAWKLPSPGDPAYLIYTSGSTGRPKGVLIPHGSAANFYIAVQKVYGKGFSSYDRCLVSTGIGFDVSVAEWLMPLCSGAAMVLFADHWQKDAQALARLLVKESVTFCYIPPALLADVRKNLSRSGLKIALDKLLVGVEPIEDSVLDGFVRLNPSMAVINGYGPTEATICATMFRFTGGYSTGRRVPIGTPLLHTGIVLKDLFHHGVPDGLPGEIYISGRQLAIGYLNNPELTAERFVQESGLPRMYRTGDRAFVLEDGNIEFIGRFDNQVKIRGFRIELGEIEGVLFRFPGVQSAAVTVVEAPSGDPMLCAYVVAVDDELLEDEDLRLHLVNSLPEYMIPVSIMKLHSLPLTPNGKIDRRALPLPSEKNSRSHVPPEGPAQIALAKIWSEVLDVSQPSIGIDDNFFLLGGHSLKAAAVVSRIYKDLEVKFPLRQLFRQPTIRATARFIEEQSQTRFEGIPVAEKRDYYPLSSSQARLLVVTRLAAENTSYNMPYFLELKGELDIQRLQDSFGKLVMRHESLRTSFRLLETGMVQKIAEKVELDIPVFRRGQWQEPLEENFVRPFDLETAPLLRVCLVQMEGDRHLMMIDMHHIITDGTSIGILIKEFMILYSGGSLPEIRISYRDYALWQAASARSDDRLRQERFWLEQFSDPPPVMNLPHDYPRPQVKDFSGSDIRFQFEYAGKQFEATLFTVLLAVYYVLLYKLSGQQDIVVGIPTAGRPHPDLEPVIGMLVNTLALRNFPSPEVRFEDFLIQVAANAIQAFENQDFQLEELVAKLPGTRDPGRNPLFDVFFVFQNMEMPEFALEKLQIKPYPHSKTTAKFDLLLEATEANGTIYFALEYSTSLFSRNTAQRIAGYYQTILNALLDHPHALIGDIDILSPEEKLDILLSACGPAEESLPYHTLHEWFSATAQTMTDRIAVIDHELNLSYSCIEHISDRGARTIASGSPPAEAVIGLLGDAGALLVTGILAILKAGCVHLPIDPQYPAERKRYMVEDSAAFAILSGRRDYDLLWLSGSVPTLSCEIFIDEGEPSSYHSRSLPRGDRNSALYVIYTSGSTGFPKGVIIEHGNLMNLILFQMKHTCIDSRRVLQFASPGFDVSMQEIFSTLVCGGCLCFMDHSKKSEPQALAAAIARYQIHTVYLPTSFLKFLFGKGQEETNLPSAVSHIVTAGEQLVISPRLQRFLESRQVTLHNHYGPSETHVVTALSIGVKDRKPAIPSIGRPIAGTAVYILDRNLCLQPRGVPGELCVAGLAVGRGYLNQPQLTEEKFVKLSLSRTTHKRAYRTGDLARFQNDGSIEFLGRIDNQVKIRGFRVEPGEIESLLSGHPSLKEAAVIHRITQSGENYLCVYFTSNPSSIGVTSAELKSFLASHVPNYMIPAFFVQLETIPLTVNGKVNRALLPEPVLQRDEANPPKPGIEAKMAEIWADILDMDVSTLYRDADFFASGGHSLKATMLIARIHKAFEVKLQLQEIFTHPTIKALAEAVIASASDRFKAIPPLEKRDYYLLSSAQKRMFVLNQLKKGHISDNISLAVLVEGELDKKVIMEAFQSLCSRHEALRTCFEVWERLPVQRIRDYIRVELEDMDGVNRDEAFAAFIRPFSLESPPLFRVGLRREDRLHHILIMDMHHIITDGLSIKLVLREFIGLLKNLRLPELRIQYKEFAHWQDLSLKQGILKEQEEFWLEVFSQPPPAVELPHDYPHLEERDYEGGNIDFCWDGQLAVGIYDVLDSSGTTLYMILLALFNILLARYSGEEDIVVGSPVAGRRHLDLEGIVGFFVNTLAMRNRPSGQKNFLSFLDEVRERTILALQNQDYQFEELVGRLGYIGSYRRNPLFEAMLSIENTGLSEGIDLEAPIAGLSFTPLDSGKRVTQFDITIQAYEIEGQIRFNFRYSVGRFKQRTIHRFIRSFTLIAEAVSTKPEIVLKDIDVILPDERKFLQEELNRNELAFDSSAIVPFLFERQVEQTPDRTAMMAPADEGNLQGIIQISFRELKRRIASKAEVLRERGIGPGFIVAFMMEPCLDMVMAILAILEAGGAYLPISASFPPKRVQYILRDSSPRLLITGKSQEIDWGVTTTSIEKLSERVDKRAKHSAPPYPSAAPENLAYIIYTSGSTGRPKGVAVRHDNLLLQLTGFIHRFDLGTGNRILLSTSVTFDASVILIFPPLLSGGSLVVVSESVRKDPRKMWLAIEREAINTMCVVPAYFQALLENSDPQSIRFQLLLLGGDVFPTALYNKLRNNSNIKRLVNIYGPTEATVDAMAFSCAAEGRFETSSLPIGKAMPNYHIAILDHNRRQVPIGVAGEIWIGGGGVAAGYLNHPETTAEVFIDDTNHGRMYRTGDRGLVQEDGNVLFLGRMDFQVKIRGFRIETSDIEAVLLDNPSTKDAAVVAVAGNEGDNQLHAFILAYRKEELDAESILEALSAELPDYMIPRHITFIDELPLNSNGKVDRHALVKLAGKERSDKSIDTPPQTRGELLLARLWAEVLGFEEGIIGRDDNFFHLGGHSLSAAVLCARVRNRLEVELPLLELFKNPTLRTMALYLDRVSKSGEQAIDAVEKRDYYPLSSPQKRFYYIQQSNPGTISYNMAVLNRVTGSLNRSLLKRAIDRLSARHDSFRTCFVMAEGQPAQRVRESVNIKIEALECKTPDEGVRAFIRPFVLEEAPLIRVGIIPISDEDCILAFDMHHIIGDGVSMGVMITELTALYEGEALPPLSIQYRDFSLWQERTLQSKRFQKQIEFWKKRLYSPLPVLDLQPDFKRPLVFNNKGRSFRFFLDREVFEKLSILAQQLNATMYMILAAIFAVLLEKYSQQEDILFGSVVAGRLHEQLEAVIGLFTNTIPLRFSVGPGLPFTDFARQAVRDCIEAFDNQDVPFEELVSALNPLRDPSRNPLFDVGFGMVYAASVAKPLHEITFTPYSFEAGTSKFDLSLLAEEQIDDLSFLMEYRTGLFKENTIQLMASHFVRLICQITSEPDFAIEEFSLLGDDEKSVILEEFNHDTDKDIPQATFRELFLQTKNAATDAIAVTDLADWPLHLFWKSAGDRHLTYKALGDLASQFGDFLLHYYHLREEDRIGIMMEPSLEWAATVLAVMIAGCAAVPLEPELPEERIRFMREDSSVALVIDREFSLGCIHSFRSKQPANAPSINFATGDDVNYLAYVIYTSGTTGLPKGVAVTHRGFAGLRCFQRDELGIRGDDRVLQFARISFDGAMFELTSAFFNGAALCIPRRDIIGNYALMESFLKKAGITVAVMPPPYLTHLSADLNHHIRILVSAGSESNDALVRRWGAVVRYFNGYGPTEATVAATVWRYSESVDLDTLKSIPIGKPIPGTRIFIMDRNHRLLPPLVPGELCIGGSSLARGYLNNPESTAQAFVNTDEGFVYKSGDLARFLSDGNLEFLGRIDQQVKIRGQRVELQEVEHQILQFPKVTAATVVLWSQSEGDNRLVAYIVPVEPNSEAATLVDELNVHLAKRLPAFMKPSYIIPIGGIPLTVNGKIDRSALPLPQLHATKESIREPENETESRLAEIWSEILEIPLSAIGTENDFFQLGGHSLKLTILLSRVLKELKIAIPLVTAIASPTIKNMALYIIQYREEFFTSKNDRIILLKKGSGQNRHLFFVHDGFGRIDAYRELALQENGDQWIWGIEANFPCEMESRETSIQDIAASYIRIIDNIKGSNPFVIGGWSLGGIIAFEMAHQLENRGEGPEKIILFDTIPPTKESSLQITLLEEGFMDDQMIPESFLNAIPNARQLDRKDIKKIISSIRILMNACDRYSPAYAINTPVLFVDAIQSPHPAKIYWKTFCDGHFQSLSIDCTHHELFQKHNIETIFDYILHLR